MTKIKYNLLYFILMLFTAVLFSCGMKENDSSNEKEMVGRYGNIEEVFNADTINKEQAGLFQVHAQQKLQDFIGYLEIIANKSYGKELRFVACEQAKELFLDTNSLIKASISNSGTDTTAIKITTFLDKVYNSEYDSIKIEATIVNTPEPKRSIDSMAYTSFIGADVNIEGYKNSLTILQKKSYYEAATVTKKTEKQFGSETKAVWEVLISEIK